MLGTQQAVLVLEENEKKKGREFNMMFACSGWDALLDDMLKNVFPEP